MDNMQMQMISTGFEVDGDMDLNILIRTNVLRPVTGHCHHHGFRGTNGFKGIVHTRAFGKLTHGLHRINFRGIDVMRGAKHSSVF